MKPGIRRMLLVVGTILALEIVLAGTAVAGAKDNSFRIVRPVAAPSGCLEGAWWRRDPLPRTRGGDDGERGEPAPEHEVRPVRPPTT